MNNSFGYWSDIKNKSLENISNLILTGQKPHEFNTDYWIYDIIGDKNNKTNVLDFGCGIGRNSYGMAYYSNDNWKITGYDNTEMINRTKEYHAKKYNCEPFFKNLIFSSDWNDLKNNRYDFIICCIVLQHIPEHCLIDYFKDFKKMTNKMIVAGRRFHDEMDKYGNHKNTWKILRDNGFTTVINYHEPIVSIDGNPNQHSTHIYTW